MRFQTFTVAFQVT